MTALATPVPLLQRGNEFDLLLDLYRERAPQRVLEVGTLHGGTLHHWLKEAPAGALVVAVDDQHVNFNQYAAWIPEGVGFSWWGGRSENPETVEFVRGHGPFNWVYIDAGHLEDEVRADWENYRPMCADGAVVCFHDISRDDAYPHIQVWKLWAELKDKHPSEEIGVDTGVLYL